MRRLAGPNLRKFYVSTRLTNKLGLIGLTFY